MGDHGTFQPFPNSAPQDIPAGQFRDFSFEWTPTARPATRASGPTSSRTTPRSETSTRRTTARRRTSRTSSPLRGVLTRPVAFDFKLTNGYDHPGRGGADPVGPRRRHGPRGRDAVREARPEGGANAQGAALRGRDQDPARAEGAPQVRLPVQPSRLPEDTRLDPPVRRRDGGRHSELRLEARFPGDQARGRGRDVDHARERPSRRAVQSRRRSWTSRWSAPTASPTGARPRPRAGAASRFP